MAQPLMPHATASWLVDNTALSFQQIAAFCGLHILEVQAIADDTAATKLTGRDPVRAGELTLAEIEKGQADPAYQLQMQKGPDQVRRTKGPRYTPVSKRQDKPDGIAWIIRNHPEISDGQISKLIGTTQVLKIGEGDAVPVMSGSRTLPPAGNAAAGRDERSPAPNVPQRELPPASQSLEFSSIKAEDNLALKERPVETPAQAAIPGGSSEEIRLVLASQMESSASLDGSVVKAPAVADVPPSAAEDMHAADAPAVESANPSFSANPIPVVADIDSPRNTIP